MTFQPIKVIDIEISEPLKDIDGLDAYRKVRCLVRWHGVPLGSLDLPIRNGRLYATDQIHKITDELAPNIAQQLVQHRLAHPLPSQKLTLDELMAQKRVDLIHDLPLVTVAVCSRNRSTELQQCLHALEKLNYPHLELVIVDNAPTNDTTKKLLKTQFPNMRYFCEPRPGLDWARNRAILEAKGEIIAYTDDDVVVDPNWVSALVKSFHENPQAMGITGLVVPFEIETKAQEIFERYGGFDKGYQPKFGIKSDHSHWALWGTGQFGTGANMAFRRCLFDSIGLFDPALDVGTVTNGGGDLEMFGRVIAEGHILIYEPNAIVRHRHRREDNKLVEQIANNGVGFYAYLVRMIQHYPKERIGLIKLGIWWFGWHSLRRLLISYLAPQQISRQLILPELWGSLRGLFRYQKARQNATQIEAQLGSQSPLQLTNYKPIRHESNNKTTRNPSGVAVCHLNLSQPLQAFTEVVLYPKTRLFVSWGQQSLGHIDIENSYKTISVSQLRQLISTSFWHQFFLEEKGGIATIQLKQQLKEHLLGQAGKEADSSFIPLAPDIPVSIVVATLDRPDDLKNCLYCLHQLDSPRPVEIVVVDNNPASGLTPPIVAQYPDVVLVNEPRKGLAYARNAGFVACRGQIAVATDDDVELPSDWLEKLVAPFARADVMVVTGNVFPIEMENEAQQSFEIYGGLGRGFERFEVDGNWFETYLRAGLPTWELGATANAAFRTAIFSNPKIGLMLEALGPGMPSGVGEDTYLFYKVLKAGYTLVYEPSAFVWHKHRQTMKDLKKQLFNYSKGHVAYHLTTVMQDGDLRGLIHIFVHLPKWRLMQLVYHAGDLVKGRLFRGTGHYPLSLTITEIWGNLLGFGALWRSYLRIRREGKSGPFIPAENRRPKFPNHKSSSAIRAVNGENPRLINEQLDVPTFSKQDLN